MADRGRPRKNTCLLGHQLTPDNVRVTEEVWAKTGTVYERRHCVRCDKLRSLEHMERRKEMRDGYGLDEAHRRVTTSILASLGKGESAGTEKDYYPWQTWGTPEDIWPGD